MRHRRNDRKGFSHSSDIDFGRPETLSEREWQIAVLYARGSTYKEIADSLHRSPATVRSHLSTVFRKLSIKNKAELIHVLNDSQAKEGFVSTTSPENEIGQVKEETFSPVVSRGKPTIAVLSFNDISDDTARDSLCDSIREDIVTELSRFSNISLLARNSSAHNKIPSGDVRQVAKGLNARYLLEGSVRVTGKNLRITVQLLDNHGAIHVWAEKYDCALSEFGERQDFFVRSIVCNVSPRIEMAELDWARAQDASGLSGYTLAMKALAVGYDAVRDADREGLEAALQLCNQAKAQSSRDVILLETNALLLMYRYIYSWGEDPLADLGNFQQAAEALIRLDSHNSKGYLLRAWAWMYQGNFDAAVLDHHLSLDLNPNLSMNLFAMSWTEAVAGLLDDAEAHASLGLQLNPREIDIWIGEGYAALAVVHLLRGDAAQSLHYAHMANQLQPVIRAVMVAACQMLGDKKGAALHLSELQSFAPKFLESLVSENIRVFRRKEHCDLLLNNLKKAMGDGARL